MPHPVEPVAPSTLAATSSGGTPARLPWPEGALLPAIIESAGDGRAVLSLPGMTLTARLSPEVPIPASGLVWLQLLDRAMPARFRLRTADQALQWLSQRLERMLSHPAGSRATSPSPGSPRPDTAAPSHAPAHADPASPAPGPRIPDWPMNPAGLPWLARAEGRNLTLRDKQGEARGVLARDMDAAGFRILGRLDLPRLGAVMFRLTGKDEHAANWSLALHAPDAPSRAHLRRALPAWLRERNADRPGPHAEVLDAWPEHTPATGLTRKA